MSESPASFGAVAPYYDELMRTVPYQMWVGYYLLLLSQQDVHPKTVLDVCCGTGTMCEMLYSEGLDMSGLDLAPGMVEAARQKAKKKSLPIRYEVADASRFEMGQTYDAALSFFDSLNNILEPGKLLSAFQHVFKHLNPGGSFVFDLNMAFAFEERMFDQSYKKKNAKLQFDWEGHWDPETRQIRVDMDFWWRGEHFQEVHRQRAYTRDEVEDMLEEAGFVEIRAYHSYTLNPPRATSDRLHFTAIRD
ncbi:class I SAM-dependent methyltransferase [bacterium]|nr:MAG: class I SAM-dependent methyltransferase [bacterium]